MSQANPIQVNNPTKLELEDLPGHIARLTATLEPHERLWRDKQPFLETRGYLLRPRYRPGWVASWQLSGEETIPDGAEDAVMLPVTHRSAIDATRIADGRLVCVKRISSGSAESTILSKFSEESLRGEKSNHCIPMLDMFQDDEDSAVSYVVMPFLRPMDSLPLFESVMDVVDFVDQVLEGLVYIHVHAVAHGDLSPLSTMMDASALFPKGFHPVLIDWLPDTRGGACAIPKNRSSVPESVKYYFTSFGKSVQISSEENTAPEDVYQLGRILGAVQGQWANIDFLKPLVRSMTECDPAQRPNAHSALRQWKTIRTSISVRVRRICRLRAHSERLIYTPILEFIYLGSMCRVLSQRIASRIAVLSPFRRCTR